MDGTILIADDDRTIRTVLTQAFTRSGCKVHATSSLETLFRWVQEGKGDLVICDVVMPDGNGLEMLPRISKQRADLPVIVISAQNNIMTAIQAAEADAYDYLPKPFDLPDLMKRAAKALVTKQKTGTHGVAPANNPDDLPLVGRSDVMQALYRLVARVMNTDLPVLITGESGVGKSLIARTVHDFSDRRDLPFVVVRGSRLETDIDVDNLLDQVQGGTLVFDEIGDFSLQAQTRLVRMLDEIDDNAPRVIATSQIDLATKMQAGDFRNDLFYRIGGVNIAVPPLRHRLEDITQMAEHFLARAQPSKPIRRILSNNAVKAMRRFTWPGNVRQLENIIRQLIATSVGTEISDTEVETVLGEQPAIGTTNGNGTADRFAGDVEKHLRRYFDLHGGALPPPGLYPRILREMEVPMLTVALEKTGGNQAKCADLLGINRNTLRKKIVDLDIHVTRRRKLM